MSLDTTIGPCKGQLLGKRASPTILIHNYQNQRNDQRQNGMSKIIPPSKRPTLDPKLLLESHLQPEKLHSSLSTVLASPNTPLNYPKNELLPQKQRSQPLVRSNETTYLTKGKNSAFHSPTNLSFDLQHIARQERFSSSLSQKEELRGPFKPLLGKTQKIDENLAAIQT